MQSSRKGEWSAITQVKVFSPEIYLIALGQEVHHSEASIAAHDNGECVLLKSRVREICKSGSERGVKLSYMAEYCDTLQSKEKRNWEHKACLND